MYNWDSQANDTVHTGNVDQVARLISSPQQPNRNSFARLLNNTQHSDLTIVLDDQQELHAHWAILTCSSEYFRRLYDSSMHESQSNRIRLKDVDKQAFQLLLQYLYTGNVPINQESAISLLQLSDRFSEAYLHQLCEQYLLRAIDCNNVGSLLAIAERFNARLLSDTCVKFATLNYRNVVDTPDFVTNAPPAAHAQIVKLLKS
jgi:hypothetical protein